LTVRKNANQSALPGCSLKLHHQWLCQPHPGQNDERIGCVGIEIASASLIQSVGSQKARLEQERSIGNCHESLKETGLNACFEATNRLYLARPCSCNIMIWLR
jgi:hypothetical protein